MRDRSDEVSELPHQGLRPEGISTPLSGGSQDLQLEVAVARRLRLAAIAHTTPDYTLIRPLSTCSLVRLVAMKLSSQPSTSRELRNYDLKFKPFNDKSNDLVQGSIGKCSGTRFTEFR
jgi:hypothetical protein